MNNLGPQGRMLTWQGMMTWQKSRTILVWMLKLIRMSFLALPLVILVMMLKVSKITK